MSIELKQAAQQVLDAFEAFGEADDFATLFTLTQKMNALRAAIQQAESDHARLPGVLKDHQIAAMVNSLRDIARQFHGHDSLRERIANVLVPALKAEAKTDVRCEGCGYMTHHREHMGCVRAAKQFTHPAPGVPVGWPTDAEIEMNIWPLLRLRGHEALTLHDCIAAIRAASPAQKGGE